MAIALLVPFTFTMQPVHGLILMGAIYVAAITDVDRSLKAGETVLQARYVG